MVLCGFISNLPERSPAKEPPPHRAWTAAKEKTRGLMGRYCFDYQCNWFVFWVIGIEKLVIVEEIGEMKQKTVEIDSERLEGLKKEIDKENSTGWYVHQIISGGLNSSDRQRGFIENFVVVYRKDEE